MTKHSDYAALMQRALEDDSSPVGEQIRWLIACWVKAETLAYHAKADTALDPALAMLLLTTKALLEQYRCPSCG
jgi:hypothetical protein